MPASVDYKDHFEPRHWELLLSRISFGSVSEVFDGKLEGRRVAPGTQTRSLGTIKNVEILELHSDSRYDKLALRIDFRDESGAVYEGWPVNDLAFRGMFNELSGGGANLQSAARDQLNRVRNAGRVYLRLGLTRPVSVGGYPELCWSQVTGVYTFPDYLDGRTWADFR